MVLFASVFGDCYLCAHQDFLGVARLRVVGTTYPPLLRIHVGQHLLGLNEIVSRGSTLEASMSQPSLKI